MIDLISHHFYFTFVLVFVVGLYTVIDSAHLVKKVVGLNLVQVSVFFMFVSAGSVDGGAPPLVFIDGPHANPLPHAIVLTAIVVGVSLTAVGLALVVRLNDEFGTVDVHEIETALATDAMDVWDQTGAPDDRQTDREPTSDRERRTGSSNGPGDEGNQ